MFIKNYFVYLSKIDTVLNVEESTCLAEFTDYRDCEVFFEDIVKAFHISYRKTNTIIIERLEVVASFRYFDIEKNTTNTQNIVIATKLLNEDLLKGEGGE